MKRKKIPRFWWDFAWKRDGTREMLDHIAIESDDDDFPVVYKIDIRGIKSCEAQVKEAEAIIDDLYAGRRDPRKMAKELEDAYE